jgi:hypothetical protein
MRSDPEFTIVKKLIHGVEVEVKVYPAGATNYVNEDELDALIELFNRADEENVTVNKTGIEHYLRKDD